MKCELISCLGTDLTVVNSARVSFENESRWARDIPALGITELSEKDKKLIKYLAKHQHFTPFTHCVITVREEVPIFVARQRFKHTVGFSYNEVSRRYVDSDPVFYHPDEWRRRAENKKQGSEDAGVSSQQLVSKTYDEFLIEAKEIYDDLLGMEVAPEQARMVLPQSMYTSYYVTGSLSAFARAYKLRIDDHAQKEIQYLAKMWNEIIEPLYPVSWAALIGETNA
jgi:thymidylate synthase (FAD)